MTKEKPNEKGTASLVLGIVSVVLSWVPLLGIAAGILAIVFYTHQKKIYPNGMATAGLVTGIVGLFFSVIYNLLWLFLGVAIIHA